MDMAGYSLKSVSLRFLHGNQLGQALSIRPDILPQVYLEELQRLQDRVPPFSNEEAKQIILEGLGRPADEIFSDMSEHPIAAASLGQVWARSSVRMILQT